MRQGLSFLFLSLTLSISASSFALHLPAIFGNGMVLQQGKKIQVWGRAEAGKTVVVRVAGKEASTKAGSDGAWSVFLPPLPSGGPYEFTVDAEYNVTFKDVLIGEVWLCSGQSNMEFNLQQSAEGADEIPKADRPTLRFFDVEKTQATEPKNDLVGTWTTTSPETAPRISAVAYQMGIYLQDELKVPVGLILSSWGGTTAETWTPQTALKLSPDLKPILDRWAKLEGTAEDTYGKNWDFDVMIAGMELLPKDGDKARPVGFTRTEAPDHLGTYWSPYAKEGSSSHFEVVPLAQGGLTEAARFKGSIEPGGYAGLGGGLREEDNKKAAVDLSSYESFRFHIQGKGVFTTSFQQPSITDYDTYRSGPITAAGSWTEVTVDFADLKQGGWGVAKPLTQDEMDGLHFSCNPPYAGVPQRPSGLYNAMIAPLAGYGLRGMAWYQGESNVGRAVQYSTLLSSMMKDWREAWKDSALPFLIVQLPNYNQPRDVSGDSGWAELRDSQLSASKSPGAALVVTIDQGEANDIHPKRKKEVGRRLALAALAQGHGRREPYSGPVLSSWKLQGKEFRLSFTNTEGGLKAMDGGLLKGFSIAGPDKVFRKAEARVEGETLIVTSAAVPTPLALRYAWADNPVCNLTNGSGLPAVPFRTDTWPLVTADSR